MRLNILFGGQAGQGANEIASLIAEILSEKGYYIFNYRDYGSLIRGGHNFNILCISNHLIQSHDWKADILLALDDRTLKEHKNNLKKNTKIIQLKEQAGKATNMLYAAALLAYLGLEKELLIKKIKEKYDEKWWKQDIEAAEQGYKLEKQGLKLENSDAKKKQLISGSQAVALAAKSSGLNFYFAYPMTPATGVLHELAAKQDSQLTVFQSGNEIEAVNAALGASYAGKLAMTGTSGGGFDLMTEALSFQGQSEIPLTVYLASRPGPSTGVPTYQAQQDINIALYGGHGEFPRIVAMPGDPEEAVTLTKKCLELAEKFNTLSIILSDKHLAESEFTIKQLPKINKIKITRKIPGKSNTIVKASSYEHLENGDTTESVEQIIKGMDRRKAKIEQIKKALSKIETYKTYGKGDKLFITAGSTKGSVLDYIKQQGGRMLQLLYIEPFPDITKELKSAKEIIVVENNSTGQLTKLIKCSTSINKSIKTILKYDARPFTPGDIK